MAALVTADGLQSCAHSEANAGNKGILEPNTVHIISAGATNNFADGSVARQEAIENGGFDSRSRHNLLWRRSALAIGQGLAIAANKPAARTIPA